MGSMDRMKRALAKREYRRKSLLMHGKRRSKYTLTGREELSRSLRTKELEFGSCVHMMMKYETESLLVQIKPCTVYQLAVALEKSEDLMRSIQVDRTLDELTSHGKAEDPWKDLLTILRRTQTQTTSQSDKIASWTEAEQWLTSSGVTLRSETADEANKKSLASYEERVFKAVGKATRRFQMKNFRIGLVSERFKQITRHASRGDELKEQERLEEEAYQASVRAIDDARIPEAVREAEARMLAEEREEEANRLASSLLRPLSEEEQDIVEDAIYGGGSPSQIVAQIDTDVVVRESMHRLQPGQWLNDEVIHYFLIMLSKRDEELNKQDPSKGRCHFFKSFFITKLLNEGHANPKIDGTYDYKNVKRWSKKVPGKDIFKLNKIIFPINQGNSHWISVVVFMREKRVQVYDSLAGSGEMYLGAIFKYLQDEHLDKKNSPLPDLDEWELVPTLRSTPRQANGFDCGVFTCMFADFVSNDCPLVFSQKHITQCRERIALSIMKGRALV